MDEAEALCSRIGIVALGHLKALDTSLQLKERFGHGFTLQLSADDHLGEHMADFLAKLHPRAVVVSKQGRIFTVRVPVADLDVAQLFSQLAFEPHLLSWLVAQASLEDVFVNVVDNRLT